MPSLSTPGRRVLLAGLALFAAGAPALAQDRQTGPASELGREVFTSLAEPACALCHALSDAGASATIGPNLDKLNPSADRVRMAVRQGLGIMPAFPGLTDEQVAAVANYVAGATPD